MDLFLKLRRGLHAVCALGEYLAWAIMLGWVVLIAAGVAARYVFASPLMFQVDLSAGLLVAFSTLCFGQLLVERSHIRVGTLADRLAPAAQRALWIVTHLLTLVYAGLVLASTATLLRFSLMLGSKFDVSGLPLWPFQVCIPIGFGLVALAALVELVFTASPRWTPARD